MSWYCIIPSALLYVYDSRNKRFLSQARLNQFNLACRFDRKHNQTIMFAEFLSQNLLWVAAFVVVANLLVLSLLQGNVRGAKMVSALQLPQLQRDGNAAIVDVNETKLYAHSHIPDSVNIPLASVNADNAELLALKEKTVILVCNTGAKSAKAARTLVSLDFQDIHILKGGMQSWTKENLPVSAS